MAWFDRHRFTKSKAYSQLPAAVYLARIGRTVGAKRMHAAAEKILLREPRDQHLLLNNRAAIGLLDETPDFAAAAGYLAAALRTARDDFSELTIITNLGLARWGLNDLSKATACANRALSVLEHHHFLDKDIYWPVCFNASQIFKAAGDRSRADAAIAFLKAQDHAVSVNQAPLGLSFRRRHIGSRRLCLPGEQAHAPALPKSLAYRS